MKIHRRFSQLLQCLSEKTSVPSRQIDPFSLRRLRTRALRAATATSIAAFTFSAALPAQTVWDAGGGATTNINLNTNWNNDTVNLLNGTQVGSFGTGGSAATMNVDGYFSTLTFNRNDAAGFTVNGPGTLSVLASSSGATTNFSVSDTAGNGVTTISAPLRLNTDAGGTRLLVIDNRETGTVGESLLISNGLSASNANAYGLRFGGSGSTRISGAISGTLTSNIQQAAIAGQNMAGTVTLAGNQSLGAATIGIAGAGSGVVGSTAKFVLGDNTSDVQSWASTTVNQAATVEVRSTATTGAIALSSAASAGSSGAMLDVAGNLSATTLALGGSAYSGTLRVSGTAAFSGAITTGATAGSKIVGGAATNGTLSLSSGTVGSSVVIGGVGTHENNLALVKASTGTLTLNGTNTYTGGTTIENGGASGSFAISLGANNALGSGPLTLGNENTGTNGARLRLNGFNQTVSALSSGNTTNARVIENFAAANSVLSMNQSSDTTFAGVLRDRSTGSAGATGNLGLTKSGGGVLTLSSPGSTYTGATVLSGGVLSVAAVGTSGVARTISTTAGSNIVTLDDTTGLTPGMTFSAATLPAGFSITSVDSPTQITISTSSNITTGTGVAAVFGVNSSIGMATNAESNLVFGGGTLRYTGGTASSNRNFSISGSNTARLDVSTGSTVLTLSGAASSGTGSFEKLGAGTLLLTGANGFSGTTTVTEGTLLVGAGGALGTGGVTVASGATLGGDGVIGGSVDLLSGANIRFSLTDSLTVNGASVTFDGFGVANLLGLDSSVGIGTYTLIDGLATIDTTNLANLGAANAFDLGAGKEAFFEIGSLNLVVVPEPGTTGLLVLGALAVFLPRRRSRTPQQTSALTLPVHEISSGACKLERRTHIGGFTLIETLAVIAILATLAAFLMPALRGTLSKGRTVKSVSQIRQIYGAIYQHVVDNDGNFPYAYGSAGALPPGGTDRLFWYNVVKVRLYPHPTAANRSALDGANGWGPPSATNTTGTVLRSPNVEKSWPKSVISYGYNNRFLYRPDVSQKLALTYSNSQTVLLADNFGNTHSLTPDNATTAGKLNARNGASRDLAGDGVAAALFLDGHTELLNASDCAALNADPANAFWGIQQ